MAKVRDYQLLLHHTNLSVVLPTMDYRGEQWKAPRDEECERKERGNRVCVQLR